MELKKREIIGKDFILYLSHSFSNKLMEGFKLLTPNVTTEPPPNNSLITNIEGKFISHSSYINKDNPYVNKDYAHQFWEYMSSKVGWTPSVKSIDDNQVTKKVTIVRRPKKRRYIINFEEMVKAIRYSVPKAEVNVVMLEDYSIVDQIKLFCETDIFVAYHGAALINIMFMRSYTTTIEILPYGFEYFCFSSYGMRGNYVKLYIKNIKDSIPTNKVRIDTSKTILNDESLRNVSEYRNYWRDQNSKVNCEEVAEAVKHAVFNY